MSSRMESNVEGVPYTAQRWRRLIEPGASWVWVVSVGGTEIGEVPDGVGPEAFEELVRALMRRKGLLPPA